MFRTFVCALFFLASDLVPAGSSDVEWDRVKKKSVRELKEILTELGIPFEADDDADDIRSLAYDESAVEQWLDAHPEERRRTMEAERKHREFIEEAKEIHKRKHPKDYSHEKDPEKRMLLERIKRSGINFDGAEGKSVEELKSVVSFLQSGAMDKMSDPDKEDEGDGQPNTEL